MGGVPYINIYFEAFNDFLAKWYQKSKQKLAHKCLQFQRTEKLEF